MAEHDPAGHTVTSTVSFMFLKVKFAEGEFQKRKAPLGTCTKAQKVGVGTAGSLCTQGHSSIIHNTYKLETTQGSIDG